MKYLIKIYHIVDFKICKLTTKLFLLLLRMLGGKARVFMMNIPEHANMGDQAIVLAEKEFFKHYFGAHYYEVTDKQWAGSATYYKKTIRPNDLICIHGGGYIGDLWPGSERMAKEVIDSFPNVKKIMMPNTIHYHGENINRIKQALSYYNQVNLFMFLRDSSSYDKAKEAGLEKIALVPDTVSFMEKNKSKKDDCQEALFCLRNDIEKSVEKRDIQELVKIVSDNGASIRYTDTVNKHGVRSRSRSFFVNKKIAEFQRARLVITDRLHGMYFAAITGTPCIAIDNISKKVSGGAYWLKDLPYIMVYDNVREKAKQFAKKALEGSDWYYSRDNRMKMFDEEARIIKSFGKVE